MTIDLATFNRRVVIERFTLVSGPLNDDEVWAPLRTVWAAMVYDDVEEVFESNQLRVKRYVRFTMHFTRDLSEIDRLVCMGVTYDIIGIKEVGNREGIEIKAKATDPGSP